jgi:hypothetical protein
MLSAMTQAARIITKFGGEAKIAALLDITVPRVQRWSFPASRGGNDGRVPPKHYQFLLDAAKARNIDLSPSDFFDSIGDFPPEQARAS